MTVSNLTVTIPSELLAWLREYKHKKCISISALVAQLIKQWRSKEDDR